MIKVRASSIAVDVSWPRTSRGSPDERLQYSPRLVLHQDESPVIDLIHTSPGGDCLGVAVEVEAGAPEDPKRAG